MSDKKATSDKPDGYGRMCFTIEAGKSCKIGNAIVTFRRVRPGGRYVDVMVVAPLTDDISRIYPPNPKPDHQADGRHPSAD